MANFPMGVWHVFRSWWQRVTGDEETPLDGDTPAWMVSMAIHVAILLGLSLYVVTREREPTVPLVINQSTPDPELDEPDNPYVTLDTTNPEVGNTGPITLTIPIPEPVAPPSPVIHDWTDIENDPRQSIGPIGLLSNDDLKQTIAPAPVPGPEGQGSVAATSAGDALDFLAAVIRDSLVQRPTTVCWLFDQSVSLAGQRKEIAEKLSNVFAQLDRELQDFVDPDLNHVAFAYGEQVIRFIQQPTRDPGDVAKAILAIPVDESGIENTFAAIREAVETTAKPKVLRDRRNVLVILFTDGGGQRPASG